MYFEKTIKTIMIDKETLITPYFDRQQVFIIALN